MANTASTAATTSAAQDPFAGQRTENNDPFAESAEKTTEGNVSTDADLGAEPPTNRTGGSPSQDRRMSKEWDASKVPPSRFQKREGSLHATQASRDGHVDRNTQKAYTDKLKEKGWHNTK